MIYAANLDTKNEILDLHSNYFNIFVKKDLSIKELTLVITNISIDELKKNKNMREILEYEGFYGFSTLSKNHDPLRNLIKATC